MKRNENKVAFVPLNFYVEIVSADGWTRADVSLTLEL
jgi:hypothetical protein